MTGEKMKFVDEYRGASAVRIYADKIAEITTRPWNIMEICGGQTHAIMRFGVDKLLPPEITLIHGPGCPVCVTPVEIIDKAIEIAGLDDVIFCSFGDMLRVPGSRKDLLAVKAEGGDIRTVYSPMDALKIAIESPDKRVVFFAVGFETTAPSTAATILQAHRRKLTNLSMLIAHVLVIPAMEAILSSPDNRVQGFLAAGHVCTVTGYAVYERLADKYGIPIVVTGFEPLDLAQGIYLCVRQLEKGASLVENQYARAVKRDGNRPALQTVNRVFEETDRRWRGIGLILQSGLKLRREFAEFNAENRFELTNQVAHESTECISGQILQGSKKPHECPAFGKRCTPEHPLGATMVSSEGACAAYYRYRKP
jgi:hydrogenase expression/formation protein HypD